jgi:hypothetical protein
MKREDEDIEFRGVTTRLFDYRTREGSAVPISVWVIDRTITSDEELISALNTLKTATENSMLLRSFRSFVVNLGLLSRRKAL